MSIYLDNNATTAIDPIVKKEMTEMLEYYGNPSSLHEVGRIVKQKIAASLESISNFFGAKEEDLIITSCASEANNTILKSVLFQKYDFKPHVIISKIEHPSILNTAKFLENHDIDVTYLNVKENGIISIKELEKQIRPETVLISVMYANNEIGTIQPILKIGELANRLNIFFHTDAVQAAGKINFKLKDLPIDSASFSAHKMYGPKGIGLLYVKDLNKTRRKLTPLIHGGHQEHGFRAGTENTLGIIGFGTACRVMSEKIDQDIEYLRNLRDTFETKVKSIIPDIIINAENAERKPCTSNISFKFIEGESILLRLDLHEICVSTGSACSTGSLDPSHVIMALAHNPEIAHGSIRFSFSADIKYEDLDFIVDTLAKEVKFLRDMSPLVK
jgi:cysteine desulfurase